MQDGRSEDERATARAPVRYSARAIRAICRRVAAGETVLAICRDADMPTRASFNAWVRENPRVAALYQRAKLFGKRTAPGRPSSYCPVTAHEIVVRVSEGEPLCDIAEDPAMPSLRVIFYWQTTQAAFAEALAMARQAQAERMGETGWKMALAATPQTTFMTRMQLGHLRWLAGTKSPRTHGRMKPVEAPAAPVAPEGPQVILFRHFHVERHFETGQHRVVSYCADPDTMRPVRDRVGPWTHPPPPGDAAQAERHKRQLRRLARKRAVEEGVDPAEIGLGPEGEDDAQWL
ncbi:hypothetical protein [Phenylobacterium sp.]|uniref:terminase small subunit-like protein n=1 Tax=Phenylobacterium sp. TaxID=1871053 RepID=UPI0025FCCDDA|nr:hypothetical protein [Phenylobacterium sp.]